MGETEDEVCRSRGAPLQVVGRKKHTHNEERRFAWYEGRGRTRLAQQASSEGS